MEETECERLNFNEFTKPSHSCALLVPTTFVDAIAPFWQIKYFHENTTCHEKRKPANKSFCGNETNYISHA